MANLSQIVISIGMALVLGLWIYLSKRQSSGEAFNILKLVRTLFVGAVLGGIASFTGFTLTAENWEFYLAANAGAVAFADQGLKMLFNLLKLKMPGVR